MPCAVIPIIKANRKLSEGKDSTGARPKPTLKKVLRHGVCSSRHSRENGNPGLSNFLWIPVRARYRALRRNVQQRVQQDRRQQRAAVVPAPGPTSAFHPASTNRHGSRHVIIRGVFLNSQLKPPKRRFEEIRQSDNPLASDQSLNSDG